MLFLGKQADHLNEFQAESLVNLTSNHFQYFIFSILSFIGELMLIFLLVVVSFTVQTITVFSPLIESLEMSDATTVYVPAF